MGVPYENATSGAKAKSEMEKWLYGFGCTQFVTGEDTVAEVVMVQFVVRGRMVKLPASYRGWQELYLEAHPWSHKRRLDAQAYEAKALQIGRVAVWSILRDWLKGMLTAIESNVLSAEHVFLPWTVTENGRTVAELAGEGGIPLLEHRP